jgi:ABC-2 type transport system permease protein
VLYANITEIAGWTKYEILFLLGVNIFTSEIPLGLFSIMNLRRVPSKIRSGEFDFILLKPLNSLFNASLLRPYFTSALSSISGFYVMYYALRHLDISVSLTQIIAAIFIFLCGMVIVYSILVLCTSFAFKFINTTNFPYIGERIMFFKSHPHHVYEGASKLLFFYIIPTIFITSIPASTIVKGLEPHFLVHASIAAFLSLFIAVKMWNFMIKQYSSASS